MHSSREEAQMFLAERGLGIFCGFVAPSAGPTLTCSLLPAAGTVSVGTSSCLSLSQHPSPTSVFRHHYIPYFRGKALRAAGCGAGPAVRLCLAVPCAPHGFPEPTSHAHAPRFASCVSSSVGVYTFPGSNSCQGASGEAGRGVWDPPSAHPWAGAQSLSLSHLLFFPTSARQVRGPLAVLIGSKC